MCKPVCRLIAVCAALTLCLAPACRRDSQTLRKQHTERGDRYVGEKKYREAIIEYRSALQADAAAADAYFKLAEAYIGVSEVQNALPNYLRAADLQPANTDAQLKAAHLLLLARKYDDAHTRARSVLEKDPNNATALLILGNALAGDRRFDEAVAANERAVALDPKRAGMYINLGALQFIRGNRQAAEAAYKAAVDADSSSVEALLGLGEFYWLSDRPNEADRQYQKALELQPDNIKVHRALMDLYIRSGRALEAEPHLKKIAESSKSPRTQFMLVDFYIATRQRERALELLDRLRADKATSATAVIKLALIDLIEGRRVEAERVLNDLLSTDRNNSAALALRAHVQLANRKQAEARASADAAVAADPKAPGAYLAQAVVAKASGRMDAARHAFNEVLKLEPNNTEALIELADVNLSGGQIETALQLAQQAVNVSPGIAEPRIMMARVLAARPESVARAQAILTDLERRLPASSDVQLALGELALAKKDTSAAATAFRKALELEPSSNRALSALAKLDLASGRPTDAKRHVDEALARNPQSPELLLTAAKVYATFDAPTAERQLRTLIDIDASNIEAYETLAALYMKQGRLEHARLEFVQITKQQPRAVAPHTMVGILSEAQGNQRDAMLWYESALRINSRAATAANNLAWLLAERGERLDDALQLAQSAHSELPRQAEITDTLGWVYLRKDMPTMAVRTLEDCVLQDGTTALYHYHLGLAYARDRQDAKARASLQRALDLDPNFSDAADARRAIAKLLY